MEKAPQMNAEPTLASVETNEDELTREIGEIAGRIDRNLETKTPKLSTEDLLDLRSKYRQIGDTLLGVGAAAGIAAGLATFGLQHMTDSVPPANLLWLYDGMESFNNSLEWFRNASVHEQNAIMAASGIVNGVTMATFGMAGKVLTNVYSKIKTGL